MDYFCTQRLHSWAITATAAIALPLLLASTAQAFEARVLGITDGDTITVKNVDKLQYQVKVRLYGIDAPEKHQAYGSKAKKHLSNLIFKKVVIVEVKGRDKYGRTLGVVKLEGVDINLQMIKDGFAWWYEKFARTEYTYARAERQANAAKIGLWADYNPTPPWKFRGTKKRER